MLINYAHKCTYIVGVNGYNNLQITRSIYFFLKRKVAKDLLNILEKVNKHAKQFREKQSWGGGGGAVMGQLEKEYIFSKLGRTTRKTHSPLKGYSFSIITC